MVIRTGSVYKIIHNQSDIVYVGSTFLSFLRHRFQHHKDSYKKYLKGKYTCAIYPYFEKYGIENFKIILIKKYAVYCDNRDDSRHLRVYEQLWINKLNCININSAFQPLKKQRYKEYRENNKQQIALKKKQYRENNKQQIALNNKKYRENNKQKIKEYQKQYRERNKQKIKEYNKKYYENNKQQISEQNQIKSYCYDCDTYIKKNAIQRHYKTIKHIKNTLPLEI
jgi:hypothetical protein